jgi:AAA15 family ATPase/GTPase
MLIEFRVQNHRSLRTEQVLTMEAMAGSEQNRDPRPRDISGHGTKLLPVAALYGANASGKTNVLTALGFMRFAVVVSHRILGPDEPIPRDPFAWNGEKNNPSVFEATFVVDSVRYEYGFVASDHAFLEEWLYAWPKGRKQIWFERDADSFEFGENLKGENKLIVEVTRPNSLFLSAAVQLRHHQLEPIYDWFKKLRIVNTRVPHGFSPDISTIELARIIENPPSGLLFDEPESSRLDQFREMLRNADIGIVDLRVAKTTEESRNRRIRFELKHNENDPDSWLPFSQESKGTQTIFQHGLSILRALEDGNPLVVDELEASLHPILALQIVKLFNNPLQNPKNAQLLFTTHDTNLLGSILDGPALRRDQVWLTEKDKSGATVLYPLTDFQPRRSENLERGYLQGRYGAIPFLGNFPRKE